MLVAGTLAAAVPIPMAVLNTQSLAHLLGVAPDAIARHSYAQTAVLGVISLLIVVLCAGLAGGWTLAGSLTLTSVQVAATAPLALGTSALSLDQPVSWAAVLTGLALGALIACNRWRFHASAAVCALAATSLAIAYVATSDDPMKLAAQHAGIPGFLLLVSGTAAVVAVAGSAAPVLGPRGRLPVAVGPLAAVLTASGRQALTADGVLQVLALMQRHGSELGDRGSELAALAGEQEVALRSLLTGRVGEPRDAAEDLRTRLQDLAAPGIEVATPAQAVILPAETATELVAAVRAALDNVRRHAGPGARAWILLEDERDGVRVTVRDDGVGFPPQREREAAEAGRLGIAQSMRGRIADRGGATTVYSRPGEGTEVEFWLPRGKG